MYKFTLYVQIYMYKLLIGIRQSVLWWGVICNQHCCTGSQWNSVILASLHLVVIVYFVQTWFTHLKVFLTFVLLTNLTVLTSPAVDAVITTTEQCSWFQLHQQVNYCVSISCIYTMEGWWNVSTSLAIQAIPFKYKVSKDYCFANITSIYTKIIFLV